jgi:uncharacterized protein (TIGR03435 family)
MPDKGTVSITNATLRDLIARAYSIPFETMRLKIVPANAEVASLLNARFDIQAKPPDDMPAGQQLLMLRSLLAARFGLRVRHEKRDVPVYALVVMRQGRLGPDIRASGADCDAFMKLRRERKDAEEPRDVYGDPVCTRSYDFDTPRPRALKMRDAGPVDELVRRLQGMVDRPVVDATGLTGNFDWVLSFSNDLTDAESPTVFQALQDRLGLKLENRTGPVEVLVIDSVQRPTEN